MFIKKKTLFYLITFVVLALIALFLYRYRVKIADIIIPFIIAIVIAYLLRPLVAKMEAKRIPKAASILILYLLFSLIILIATVFVIPELMSNTKEIMTTLPDLIGKYQRMFNHYITSIQYSKWSPDIKNAILNEVQNGSAALQSLVTESLRKALNLSIKMVTIVFDLALSMFIAYYFIKDANFFRDSFLTLIPRKWRNGLISTGREINAILSNFLQGQLTTALIVGIMESIGLFIIQIKYPLVLGLIGGLANVIPYFGPFLGAIPAIAIALLDSPLKAIWTILVFAIVQQIDNAFISPKIIEGKLGLHPVTTVLAVLVGGEFFGIFGMFIAVPVFAVIKVIVKRSIEAIV